MARSNTDPVLQHYREQVAANDQAILEALNTRLRLVKNIKDRKASQGLDFYDAGQETTLIAHLLQANRGPMSDQGLREVFGFILEWTKHEVTGPTAQ